MALEADRTRESRASPSPRGKLQLEGQTLQEAMESILMMSVQASGGNARAKVVKWDSDIEQVQPGILKIVLSHEGLTLPQKLDRTEQIWKRHEAELTAEVTALQVPFHQNPTAAGAIHKIRQAGPPVLLHMQHSSPQPIPKTTTSAPAQIIRPNGRRTARLPGGGNLRSGPAMPGVAQRAQAVVQGPVVTQSSPETTAGVILQEATPYRSRRRSPTFRATTGSLVQSSQVAQLPGGTTPVVGLKEAAVSLRDTEMTRTPQMAEPPRSPAPSTTSNALGLTPRTIPARSTARSWPQQDHAITNDILESRLSAPEAEGALYKSPQRAP